MTEQQKKTPDVSVIVPVYNVEKYIRQGLDSIAGQTLKNIEIICVDDGSTDSSSAILEEYATKDPRFKIIRQKNQFAGIARNTGFERAIGTYVAFLDSDDFFEPTLLEDAFHQCEQDDADICIYSADYYYSDTDTFSPFDTCLYRELIPNTIPFSWRDLPHQIFQLCVATPWNKLYRRSMLLKHQLRYPNLKRSEDSPFACMALACAEKITILDKVLVHYRQAHGNNQQSGTDKTPLDWFMAQMILKEELIKHDLFDVLKCSYFSFMIGNGHYYLGLMKSIDGVKQTYNSLRNELIKNQNEIRQLSDKINPWFVDIAHFFITHTCESYLFEELKKSTKSIQELKHKNDDFHKQLKSCLPALNMIKKQYQFLSRITLGKKRKKYREKTNMIDQRMREITDSDSHLGI